MNEEEFEEKFAKFTNNIVSVLNFIFAFAICYRVFVFSRSWFIAILTFPILLITQTIVIANFFVKELTLDEDKLSEAVENAHPWLLLLNAAIYLILTYW